MKEMQSTTNSCSESVYFVIGVYGQIYDPIVTRNANPQGTHPPLSYLLRLHKRCCFLYSPTGRLTHISRLCSLFKFHSTFSSIPIYKMASRVPSPAYPAKDSAILYGDKELYAKLEAIAQETTGKTLVEEFEVPIRSGKAWVVKKGL